MEKKITTHVVKGLIISLILIVLGLVTYFTGLYLKNWIQYAVMLIFMAGIVWAVFSFGKEKNNEVTFGNLFAHGFKTAAVVTCIMIVYSVVFGYIFPEMKEKIIEQTQEQMSEKAGVTQAQIDQTVELMKKSFTLFMILGLIFWYLLVGVIASLIGAGVAKKNQPSPFQQQA
jgi:amino acid transporter